MAPLLHIVFVRWRPEPLVLFTIFAIGCVALSLYLLPRLKGAVVGFQWARRMHGFGDDDLADEGSRAPKLSPPPQAKRGQMSDYTTPQKADKTAVRNAATVIVLRDRMAEPRVLMGQRGARAAFMPNKFVFPGGAVDPADAGVPLARRMPQVCRDRPA